MSNGDKVTADYLMSLKEAEIENYKVLAALETIRVNQFVPFNLHIQKTSGSDTTSQYIYSDQFESGYVYIITSICVQDVTDAANQIKIGIYDGSTPFVYAGGTNTVAGEPVSFVGQLMCKETDKIFAELRSIGASDEIHMYINGYKIKK